MRFPVDLQAVKKKLMTNFSKCGEKPGRGNCGLTVNFAIDVLAIL